MGDNAQLFGASRHRNQTESALTEELEEHPIGGISSELKRLTAEVEELERSCGVLFGRIETVLTPEPPEMKDYDRQGGPTSELCEYLAHTNSRLRMLRDTVEVYVSRVDL